MPSDLDKYVTEREVREPGFAALVEAAEQRRAFAREMAERRRKHGLSQTQVAAKMKTSPSIVSRIESGGDVRLSTLEKYLVALGFELTMQARRLPHGAG
ncbi:MAG: helix-turn-helix domain-containing protein [Deltaproteobacteria bacterium]|nr:helix-turn-helix domain-containing protein [Deltaproteobacteria bacterium]